jgi:hypothetical protein
MFIEHYTILGTWNKSVSKAKILALRLLHFSLKVIEKPLLQKWWKDTFSKKWNYVFITTFISWDLSAILIVR